MFHIIFSKRSAKKKGVEQGAPQQMDDGEVVVRRVHLRGATMFHAIFSKLITGCSCVLRSKRCSKQGDRWKAGRLP